MKIRRLITNPKRLKARLKIPEVQARDVRIELTAEIDTYNGKIPGKVSRIDPTVMEGNVTVDIALNGALPDGAVEASDRVERIGHVEADDLVYLSAQRVHRFCGCDGNGRWER